MHVPVVQLHAYTLATTKIAEENLVRVSDTKDLLHYLAAKRKKKFRYDDAEVQHRNPDRPNRINLILPRSRSRAAPAPTGSNEGKAEVQV